MINSEHNETSSSYYQNEERVISVFNIDMVYLATIVENYTQLNTEAARAVENS